MKLKVNFNQIFSAPGSIPEQLQVLGSNYEVELTQNGNGPINGSVVAPGELPLSELSDPDNADDPGWIQLGKMDTGSDKIWGASEFSTVNGKAINDFLSISFTNGGNNAGTWSIGVNANSIGTLENDILGRQATFDHLALVLKAGNGFYIYDFDFKDIFAAEFATGNIFNFRTEYTFSGTWDTSLLKADLSHASVWVRDPVLQPPGEVNAPTTLSLLLASLLGTSMLRRYKAKTQV